MGMMAQRIRKSSRVGRCLGERLCGVVIMAWCGIVVDSGLANEPKGALAQKSSRWSEVRAAGNLMTPVNGARQVASILSIPQHRERTRVRIEGLQRRSEAEVLEWLGARLTHVRAAPPSAPLAEDAALILKQLLIKDGNADAQVNWSVHRDVLTLRVQEGLRLTLGEVSLRGLPPDDAGRLVRIFSGPMEKDRPLGLSDAPFREADVEKGLSLVARDLHASGYWQATATLRERRVDEATGKVNLGIEVQAGPVHLIGPAIVRSRDGRGVKLTLRAQQPSVGKIANTAHINAMRRAVEDEIARRGYPEAQVLMRQTTAAGVFHPEFVIDLGKRVKLDALHVRGLVRTSPERILRRFRTLLAEYYDEPAMNRRVRELLATGAFRSVRLETEPAGHRRIDATLHLEESRAREVQLAAGVGSYLGPLVRAIYTDRNFNGQLWALNAGVEFSARGMLGEARVTDPWLFGSDVSCSLRSYALTFNREGYDTFETGLDGRCVWRPTPQWSLECLAGMALVNLSEDGLPARVLGETVYSHQKVRFTALLDHRDHPVLPTSGWHVIAPIEIGTTTGDTAAAYSRAAVEAGAFVPLSARWDLGLGAEWAALVPANDGGDLPIDLRIFNGGTRSVRSFPERELGPTVRGFPTGGEAMWNANLECVYRLAGPVRAVVFADAGALSRQHSALVEAEVECALGVGLRLHLPIGPVRIEYGHNLTHEPGEPNGTVHFAIGHAF